jgi:hypothetical protein
MSSEDLKQLNASLKAAIQEKNPISVEDKLNPDVSSGPDYNEKTSIYSSPLPDVFIQVVISEDSYGNNEKIKSIQFVKATQKIVLDYQPL